MLLKNNIQEYINQVIVEKTGIAESLSHPSPITQKIRMYIYNITNE